MMTFNYRFLGVLVFAFGIQTAAASNLQDCRQKVYEMYRPFAKTEVKELAEGSVPVSGRVDTFHMNSGNTCGVEVVEDKGYVRVNQFEGADQSNVRQIKFQVMSKEGSQILGVKKFETIKLDENDPTYAEGRIKAQVSCEISGDTVIYTTKTPAFADGVRSPFSVTKLELKRQGDQVSISLTAGVSGALWPFRSVTSCNLEI